jgi:autotransporter-associated beta strand protein
MTPSPKNPRPHTRRARAAILGTSIAALLCFMPRPASAQTWVGQIGFSNGSWNTANNWDPATVPNAPGATATFGFTTTVTTTSILLPTSVQLGALSFNADATVPYRFTNAATLTLSGGGIANNSGGYNEYFENLDGAAITFNNSASAGLFTVFTNDGAASSGAGVGALNFDNTSSADTATIINLAGAVTGAAGGTTVFGNASTAATATIITNGGATFFEQTAGGGTASAFTNGVGVFDISGLTNAGLTIGSIAGSGTYNLGGKTLTVGGNNASTTVSGTIADGGRFGGTGGSLVKTGTGTLTLAGTNTYTGATVINGGILQVNGAIQSVAAVTVNSGGTLAGTGTLAGPVTVNSGGVLAHSNSNTPGTITVGGLTLNSGSKSDFELGVPNTVGGTANDLTVVNGNLTLGGTLNITDLAGFGIGSYELFTYTGTLTGATMSFGSLPAGFTAADFSIQTSTAHQVDLLVSAVPAVQNWSGGSGTWGGGSVTNFGTGTGTITVASNISAGEIRFGPAAGAYTFNVNAGNTITISGAGITNSSSATQTFVMGIGNGGSSGSMNFTNSATAGNATITVTGSVSNMTGLNGATIQFSNTSTAGSAQITNGNAAFDDGGGGTTAFVNGSNAGTEKITNQGGYAPGGPDYNGNGQTVFSNTSGAGHAQIVNQQGSSNQPSYGGVTTFQDNSTAGTATINNVQGVDTTSYGQTYFIGNATAGAATIINQGASIALASGGVASFGGTSTAGNATIVNQGGSGGEGGATYFNGTASAGNATISIQGGTSGGAGGATYFTGNSDGGTAQVISSGNGVFDISGLASSGMNIGSIQGAGTYNLGSKTLTVGGNNLTTTLSGAIADGGLSGGAGGSLVKTGAGTLTLLGTNTYTGTTVINNGALQVNGAIQSTAAVTVNTGGTLGGSGTVDGPVTVNAGGTLAHGVSGTPATFTVAGLTLNSGSFVDYQLAAPGTAGGGVNDLTVINGNLALGGTLNLSGLPGFGVGTYELFTYTGTLTGNTMNIGTVPVGYVAQDFTVQTSVNDQVNLIVSSPLYWNGAVTTANGAVNGGTGNWNNATTNWTDVTGTATSAWPGLNGFFSGTTGTVTLTSNITFAALEFSTPNYVIAPSGSFGLSFSGGATIATDPGADATISAPIQGNGVLVLAGSANLTLSGALTDSGGPLALTHNSSGTTILSNAGNTYSGPTTINNGTLQIGTATAAGSIGAGAVGVHTGGTLTIVNINGDALANNISNGVGGVGTVNINSANVNVISGALADGAAGQLALTQSGSGTTVLTANNTYTGATTVSAGTLQIGSPVSAAGNLNPASVVSVAANAFLCLYLANNGVLANSVINDGTVEAFNNLNTTQTVSGVISGSGNFLQGTPTSGIGTTILANNNTYQGGTIVTGPNFVQVGTGSAAGSVGTGAVALNYGGTLTLVNVSGNTFSNNVTNGVGGVGTLVVNSAQNVTLQGSLTDGAAGQLAFTQSGSGTTTLSSANTYSGGTAVTAGLLAVTNPTGSATGAGAVMVSGGTLTGTGTIGGIVTLAGGSLLPGSIATAGTITVGGLNLSSGTVDLRLAQPGGASNDLVDVTNNLTLGGTLNVEPQAGFTTGTYTLFDYGGTLNGSFSSITGLTGYTSSIVTTTPGEVLLTVSSYGTVQFWDGTGAPNSGVIAGGSGNWSATGNNWTNSTGLSNSTWQSGTAVFGAPGGTVTLTSPISAQVLIFNSGGYTLAGGQSLTLTGPAAAIDVTNAGTVVTVGVPIAGSAGLAQQGAGTLILTNSSNTYTGATNISTGTLQIGTTATMGKISPGSAIGVSNGGTLSLVNVSGNTFANSVSNGAAGVGTLNLNSTATLTLSGALADGAAGQLAVTQSGAGTTILTNAGNTYSGATNITQGTLQLGTAAAAGSIGANSAVSVGNGATFTLLNVSGGVLANNVSNGAAGTGTVNVASTGSITLSGTLANGSGTLAFKQTGTGTTTLTGNDSYGGATTITAGVLQIGNGTSGNLSTSSVTVSNSASLVLDQAHVSTTPIDVNLSASGTTLKSIQSGLLVLTGVISGPGVFDQNGTGTTELQAAQTYTGATNVNLGILSVTGSLAAASTVNVATAGTLDGTGTINGKVTLTGNGIINLGSGGDIAGALTVTGGNWNGSGTVGGLVTASSGVFTIGSGANLTASSGLTVASGTLAGLGTLTGHLNYASASSSTFAGIIAGTGATLTMSNGSATLTLTGANTYTGATTVGMGTLQIGNGSSGSLSGTGTVTVSGSSSLAVDLANGSTLANPIVLNATGTTLKAINAAGLNQTISGVIGGTGVFDQNGAGTTILSNTDTYTGATNVTAGTLQINGSLAAGSTVNVGTAGTLTGAGTIYGKATLTGNGIINLGSGAEIAGTLAVTGGNWNGAGTVVELVTSSLAAFTLGSGANLTATAGLDVTGGTLAGPGTLTGNLNYASSTSSTFGGVIAGPGATLAMSNGSATLTLTGTNTFTGATTVSMGTLQVGNGTSGSLATSGVTATGSGVLAIDLANNASFTQNVNLSAAGTALKAIPSVGNTNTLSGIISGSGVFNQNGPGTTILSNVNTYTGATNVNAGILQVDGSLAASSKVSVASGATLSGAGTVSGAVSILAGGNLNPGDSSVPGTIAVGSLVLNAGSNSNFRLATPGTTGGGVNDLVSVTNNLTIAGNLNVTQLTNFGIGSYTLFTYGGALTNTGFSAINGIGGFNATISTGVAHQVNLVISGTASTQYWDGTGTPNDGVISGGSGTWNNSATNWTNPSGTVNSTWQGGTAIFDAPGGAVTLGAPLAVQGLVFGTTGYTIGGSSALNMVGGTGNPPVINVTGGGEVATISAPLGGNAGLIAIPAGTLILTNASNPLTGTITVDTGTLQLGTSSAATSIKATDPIIVANGGTLSLVNVGGNTFANNIGNGFAGIGTLNFDFAHTMTISGALTDTAAGVLAVNQTGAQTTILTNPGNDYRDATTISAGILQIGTSTAAGSLGPKSTVSVGTGGTLTLVNLAGNNLGNNIINGVGGTGTVNVASTAGNTLSGVLSNGTATLALTQSGTGTTTLTGANTYTGPTTVSAGTLQVGNGATGSLASGTAVTVNAGATLALDLPTASTFSNTLTDNGHVTATGAGSIFTLSSTITGAGNFSLSRSNTVTVTGANTYTGGTAVRGGTLLVDNTTGSGTGTGAVAINNGGTLGGSGKISGATTLNSGGSLFPSAGTPGTAGTTLHASSLTWNGGSTLTLQLADGADDALALSGALTRKFHHPSRKLAKSPV